MNAKFCKRRFLKTAAYAAPLMLVLIWLLPLIIWYRLTEYSDHTVSEFFNFVGKKGVIIYSIAVVLFIIVYFVKRYMDFSEQLKDFHFSGKTECEYKLALFRLTLTDEGLICTNGMAVRYADIDRVLIECSETESLNVYHMYVYRHEGKRLMIPVGLRTMPKSFDAELEKYNVEVLRQMRPLFGRSGRIRNE